MAQLDHAISASLYGGPATSSSAAKADSKGICEGKLARGDYR
jgi:hypothetical protein